MRAKDDRGSAIVELLVFVVPVLLLLLVLVVYFGRVSSATVDVRAVARDSARAASRASSPAGAIDAAREVTAESRSLADRHCSSWTTTVDTSQFGPGGLVTVTVGCTLSNRDLSGLGLPGSKTLTGRAVEAVDPFGAVGN